MSIISATVFAAYSLLQAVIDPCKRIQARGLQKPARAFATGGLDLLHKYLCVYVLQGSADPCKSICPMGSTISERVFAAYNLLQGPQTAASVFKPSVFKKRAGAVAARDPGRLSKYLCVYVWQGSAGPANVFGRCVSTTL